ncbi:MAG: hypothetical protein LBN71_08775, partial [Tannerella sp.]|nr:hypothetical protein [Tannerella sp.]
MKRSTEMWAIIIVLTVAMMACHKDENSQIKENNRINDWILENMQIYYLWEDKIPARTDKNLSPEDYFESLLYKAEDRFSWIEENFVDLMNSFSGVTKEAGYDFSLVTPDNVRVIGIITYIKPNSPAEKAGLKRGDVFSTINKKKITVDNYRSLLGETGEAHTLGIANDKTLSSTTEVSLSVVVYEENPILLDTVYTIDSKQIGYLVYNFFAPDNGNNSRSYEKQLNDIFANFKSAAIDELVLDLRYNGGGYISTAIVLSGMISNCTSQDMFGYERYNKYLQDEKIYFEDAIEKKKYDDNGKVIAILE